MSIDELDRSILHIFSSWRSDGLRGRNARYYQAPQDYSMAVCARYQIREQGEGYLPRENMTVSWRI